MGTAIKPPQSKETMRLGVCVLVLCVCFASALPTAEESAVDDQMRMDSNVMPPRLSNWEGFNDVAGTPGSDLEDFPPNLLFAEPCDDMNDLVTVPSLAPTPLPSPTSDIPPPEHIAWEVVGLLTSMCRKCHCGCQNVTQRESLVIAKDVFRLLPSVTLQLDSCPAFMKKNPDYPNPPTPSPSPSISLAVEAKWAGLQQTSADNKPQQHDSVYEAMQKAIGDVLKAHKELKDAGKIEPARLKELTLQYHDAIATAESRASAAEEVPESSMTVLPHVPDDCEDDPTGTVGVTNDDVVGSSSGMNQGYSPNPRIYLPQTETLKARAGLVEPLKSPFQNFAFLESDVFECTVFEAMRVSPDLTSSSTVTADVPAECSKACVFDDGCKAWHLKSNTRECHLFSQENPLLVKGSTDDVAGVCPGVRKCTKHELSSIVTVFTSPAGREANCSKHLEQLTAGGHIDMAIACGCVAALDASYPTDECTVNLESATFENIHSLCKSNRAARIVNLVQSGLPDCKHTGTFNAGLGSCLTYDETALPITNFLHCGVDRDSVSGLLATEACPQCGKCAPTPGPTPWTPPPELATSSKLPNGDTTECLQARSSAQHNKGTGPLQGWYVPQCFMDGSYMPTQCLDALNMCWCVYENGVEIPNTRFIATAPSGSRPTCRPSPPMKPIVPVIPEPKGNEVFQAVRALSKLVYAYEPPATYCRVHKNTTIEQHLMRQLRRNITEGSQYCSQRPLTLHSLLHMVAVCLVPPPPPLPFSQSQSPSFSPSVSITPSISLSPSPSPSAPVPMCGDVVCTVHKDGHIAKNVPPGWCQDCVQGTSGPCRHPSTYECVDFMYGAHCNYAYQRCADIPGLSAPFPRPECAVKTGNHSDTKFELVLDTPMTETATWVLYYLVPIASAISEVVGVDDVCDISLASAVAETQTTTRVVLSIRRDTLEQAQSDVNKLRDIASTDQLTLLFSRRGIAPRTALESVTPFGALL